MIDRENAAKRADGHDMIVVVPQSRVELDTHDVLMLSRDGALVEAAGTRDGLIKSSDSLLRCIHVLELSVLWLTVLELIQFRVYPVSWKFNTFFVIIRRTCREEKTLKTNIVH